MKRFLIFNKSGNEIESGTKDLWVEVSKYRDAIGLNPFENIQELAIKLLCLPHSNGDVERVFSQINLIKNKTRNRLSLEMLEAILIIKFGLQRNTKCCFNYIIPENVIKKIGTMATYNSELMDLSTDLPLESDDSD